MSRDPAAVKVRPVDRAFRARGLIPAAPLSTLARAVSSFSRTLALAIVVAHCAVVIAPCAGVAAVASEHHEVDASDHAAHSGSREPGSEAALASVAAGSHAEECGGHAKRPATEATAPCPCGCDDASAPGTSGSRVGFGLPSVAPDPLIAVPPQDFAATAPRLPVAPADRRDPIPI